MSSILRSYARVMAHRRMKEQGLVRVNDKGWFSRHWHEYAYKKAKRR